SKIPYCGITPRQLRCGSVRLRSRPGFIGCDTRIQVALILVPHLPSPEDRLEPAVAHRLLEDRVDLIPQPGVLWRQDPDVVTHTDTRGLVGERWMTTDATLGEHFVEQHGIYTPDRQVRIRVHIVLVWNDDDSMFLFSSG